MYGIVNASKDFGSDRIRSAGWYHVLSVETLCTYILLLTHLKTRVEWKVFAVTPFVHALYYSGCYLHRRIRKTAFYWRFRNGGVEINDSKHICCMWSWNKIFKLRWQCLNNFVVFVAQNVFVLLLEDFWQFYRFDVN